MQCAIDINLWRDSGFKGSRFYHLSFGVFLDYFLYVFLTAD